MTEDEWGYDDAFAGRAGAVLGLLHDVYWRVRTEGADRVPAQGGALLVANHAGDLPWDALMVARSLPRPVRFLVGGWAFDLPYVSIAVRRMGGVPAAPANAERLLRQGHLVLALAEPSPRRYRVGRVPVVELALRAGVPVVPVAVVGHEEARPSLKGLPLGPLRLVPLPSRWRIELGEPLDLRSYDQPLEAAEAVRERIQTMVYDNLVRREGAFL